MGHASDLTCRYLESALTGQSSSSNPAACGRYSQSWRRAALPTGHCSAHQWQPIRSRPLHWEVPARNVSGKNLQTQRQGPGGTVGEDGRGALIQVSSSRPAPEASTSTPYLSDPLATTMKAPPSNWNPIFSISSSFFFPLSVSQLRARTYTRIIGQSWPKSGRGFYESAHQ